MDDFDFYEALSRDEYGMAMRKQANAASEALKKTVEFVKTHPQEIAGAAIGAAVLGGVQYWASRKAKGKRESEEQEMFRKLDQAGDKAKLKGFTPELSHSLVKGMRGTADVSSKYPIKAALLFAAPLGASAGWQLAAKYFK